MQNEELEIIRMSEIQMREVEWLWYPYISFGKLKIIQGDPGEGKETDLPPYRERSQEKHCRYCFTQGRHQMDVVDPK